MKATTAIAGMLAAAAVGAGAAGWIVSSHADGQDHAWPTEGDLSRLSRTPVGDLAGAPVAHVPLDEANPLGDKPEAIAEGNRLFVKMNCAGCHNYGGRGGMGPDLTDGHWDFGGTPAAIFKSIYEGHAKGMPAWGRALPPEAIWELTAYVHSLGGGVPPSQAQAERRGDFVPEQRDTEQPMPGHASARPREETHGGEAHAAAPDSTQATR